jgi:hypothetical protein
MPRYNAKRQAALLRKAACYIESGDFLSMGRAIVLALRCLPTNIRIMIANGAAE